MYSLLGLAACLPLPLSCLLEFFGSCKRLDSAYTEAGIVRHHPSSNKQFHAHADAVCFLMDC